MLSPTSQSNLPMAPGDGLSQKLVGAKVLENLFPRQRNFLSVTRCSGKIATTRVKDDKVVNDDLACFLDFDGLVLIRIC